MQQNDIYNLHLPRGPGPKKQKKRQRTWDKLPGGIKTSDSSRGHIISTRDGSVIDSDLTYTFWNMDCSSHGVFVSKKQTKVNYPLQQRARETASPPLYFRSLQDCQPHPLVPTLAASTFAFGAISWRYRGLKF
jgi:hypothetical protein